MLKQLKNGYFNASSFPDFISTPDLETYAHLDE